MSRRRATPFLALLLVGLLAAPSRAEVEVLFTTDNTEETSIVGRRILRVLRSAERSIDIMVAHLNSRWLARSLIRFHRRHNLNLDPDDDVAIRVLLDLGELDAPISRARELELAGIPVRYKTYSLAFHFPTSQLLHHKVLIRDGRELITGSYNWSWTAEHENEEDILHVHGEGEEVRRLVDRYAGEFERLWTLGRDAWPAFRRAVRADPDDPARRRIVPVHFDSSYFDRPMTLTRREIESIREPLRADGFPADPTPEDLEHRYFDRERGRFVDRPDRTRFLERDR